MQTDRKMIIIIKIKQQYSFKYTPHSSATAAIISMPSFSCFFANALAAIRLMIASSSKTTALSNPYANRESIIKNKQCKKPSYSYNWDCPIFDKKLCDRQNSRFEIHTEQPFRTKQNVQQNRLNIITGKYIFTYARR